MTQEHHVIVHPPSEVASFDEIQGQAQQLDKFYRSLMSKGTDYDTIPGTPKPTLLKPGAELLRLWAGLTPMLTIDNTGTDLEKGIYHYQVKCSLYKDDRLIAEGVGNCTSLESKYRWRWAYANQLPPDVDKESLTKKWIRTKDNRSIPQFRMDNENPHDQANTILKMAKKRAFVDAILTATGASRIFTQDVEDLEPATVTLAEPDTTGEEKEIPGFSQRPTSEGLKQTKQAIAEALPRVEQREALESLAAKMWAHIESRQGRSLACGRWLNGKYGKGWAGMTEAERNQALADLAEAIAAKKEPNVG